MNGIITIAVGDIVFGKMASNLAISIKHKSEIPICIIYTDSAFEGHEHLLSFFDLKIRMEDTNAPTKLAMSLKVNLNKHTPFDKTIFLDSDCIINPTHSADEWFGQLQGIEFTAYNSSIYPLSGSPYKWYRHWAEPSDIKNYFLLPETSRIPQINSSFLYWEKGGKSDSVFDKARFVMKSKLKHEDFRGEFPDELAFNVACCITGILPHRKTFKPVYLHILQEHVSKEYILENFAAMSVIGGTVKDSRIQQYYNDFVEYYTDMQGIRVRHYYEPKIKDKTDRKIMGFFHICMINNFEQIVKEQVNELITSGLYKASEKINVVLAGDMENAKKVRAIICRYPKMVVADVVSIKAYEFPTLNLIKKHSNTEQKFFYYYIHTKGVSFPNHAGGKHWRDYMMHYNVAKWSECVDKLKDGFETCGCKLYEHKKGFPKHYSGNFWWAKSEYIQRCPPVEGLNQTDRFEAEFWLCKASPNSASLCQIYIDYDQNPAFK